MAYRILICRKLHNDNYWYNNKVSGYYNQNLSLYFAYLYSIFDFNYRYCIVRDLDFKVYTDYSLLQEKRDFKDKDILNILKSRNYEI